MKNDVTQGLAIGIAFAGLVSLFPSQANAQMDSGELCDASIKYAIKYMPETEAFKLHNARWKIMDGDNTGDEEKMVGLVMFEIGQRISYSMTDENNPSNKEWWDGVLENWYTTCQNTLEDERADDFSEMDGSGDIW
jgi:hypothetical protein